MPNCPICKASSTVDPPTGDALNWHCPQCGSYRLAGTAESILREKPIAQFGAVSGWIRQQNALGIIPTISDVDMLRRLTKPPFRERAERYLLAVVAKASQFNAPLTPAGPDLTGASYSEDEGDVSVIRQYLVDEELIVQRQGGEWRITAKGFITADDLRARRAASSQAFVAMWFHEDLESAYSDGISAA